MTDIRCRNCNGFNTLYSEKDEYVGKKLEKQGYVFCIDCGVTRMEPYIDEIIWDWIEKEARKQVIEK